MKRRRFSQIGTKVQQWNDENVGPLDSNFYHFLYFDTTEGSKDLSDKGKRLNKQAPTKAANDIGVSISQLKEWFTIFEKRERRKSDLRLEKAVANEELTPAEARAMREA